MVSRNYSRLGSAVESMWSRRDWKGAVAAGGALAAGSVVVGSLADKFMEVMFDSSAANSQTRRLVKGFGAMAIGLGVAGLGGHVGDGYAGETLMVMGVAGLAMGGGLLGQALMDVNLLENTVNSVSGSLPGSGRSASRARRQVRSANSRNGSRQSQRRTPSANRGRTPSAYS